MPRHGSDTAPGRRDWLMLAGFLALTLGGGLLIGLFTAPDAWYADLEKPPFNPPDWVFGPVWTFLYILIGVAGWLIWRADDGRLAVLWWVALALNFLWSPLFFAAHMVAAALVVVVALLLAILAVIARTWRGNRTVAVLFLPYALWVGYASLLNGSILVLN